MKLLEKDVKSGSPSRETVMSLKDTMAMLHALKDRENTLLKNLTDEELEKLSKTDV